MRLKIKTFPVAQLEKAAARALKNAYSPYSKVKVGCAVLGKNGQVFSGCNVENASYGATICAERTAITKMISEGFKTIEAILILTHAAKPWAPCGMCRQVILEFSKPDTPVILTNHKGKSEHYTVGELCPVSFSPKQML